MLQRLRKIFEEDVFSRINKRGRSEILRSWWECETFHVIYGQKGTVIETEWETVYGTTQRTFVKQLS